MDRSYGYAMGDTDTTPTTTTTSPAAKSDAEWRAELTPEQYRVLRQKSTERAFSGALWDENRPGTFPSAGRGAELVRPHTKCESGNGYPSFLAPADPASVV